LFMSARTAMRKRKPWQFGLNDPCSMRLQLGACLLPDSLDTRPRSHSVLEGGTTRHSASGRAAADVAQEGAVCPQRSHANPPSSLALGGGVVATISGRQSGTAGIVLCGFGVDKWCSGSGVAAVLEYALHQLTARPASGARLKLVCAIGVLGAGHVQTFDVAVCSRKALVSFQHVCS
jgi:hypothetical protein